MISCSQTQNEPLADSKSSSDEKKSDQKIISDPNNKLLNKVEQLEVEYTVWGCACPNWIQSKFNERNDTITNYLKLHFYIEPANKSLELPTNFDAFRHRLKLTGQFYENEDYPQGTIEMEEPMSKARVFRYSTLELIDKPNF